MKKDAHYRQVLRLVSGIGRLTNPQHLPALSGRRISLSQFLVLDALADARAPVRMAELARRAGVTVTELSRVAASLEEGELVRRQTDPEDSRARLVALTDAGGRLYRDAERQAVGELSGVWNDFTHDEWHRFIDYLARFEAALRRERERPPAARRSEGSNARKRTQARGRKDLV